MYSWKIEIIINMFNNNCFGCDAKYIKFVAELCCTAAGISPEIKFENIYQ